MFNIYLLALGFFRTILAQLQQKKHVKCFRYAFSCNTLVNLLQNLAFCMCYHEYTLISLHVCVMCAIAHLFNIRFRRWLNYQIILKMFLKLCCHKVFFLQNFIVPNPYYMFLLVVQVKIAFK